MEISLVMPNRNNLKYFKWAYDSIRKNQGNHTVWICSAADACMDGTVEHYEELAKIDPFFKYIVNNGPERLGHTILYDKIIWDLVETDLAMIFHCDMYLCPDALDAIEKLMYNTHGGKMIRPEEYYNRVVSLTRIEPPLHPPGKEKVVKDFGTEPENFNENGLIDWMGNTGFGEMIFEKFHSSKPISSGVFAPWAFWVDEYKAIGGNDWANFSPQSKEDSIGKDVLLFVEIDGIKSYMTVSELWGRFSTMQYKRLDGKCIIDTRQLHIKILSPSLNGVYSLKKVNALIKKNTNAGNLVNVRTNWGEVVVTKDHSLINTNLEAVKVSDISDNALWEPLVLSDDSLRRNLLESLDINDYAKSDINLPDVGNVDEYGNNKQLIDICEFLGFFVAEGSTHMKNDNSGTISICSNDIELLENIKNKSSALFGDNFWNKRVCNKKDNCKDVYAYRRGHVKYTKFMQELVGGDSKSKQVPDFIFNLPKVYQKSFLYGYLCGDGYLGTSISRNNSMYSFSVDKRLFLKKNAFDLLTWKSTSKSKKLTSGINYLLRRLFPEVKTRINFQSDKGVEGVYNISTCKFHKHNIVQISPYITDNEFEDVYDLEVGDTHSFIGGVGLIGLHNSDIWNRSCLNGTEFLQTWEGFVYHMTCRGSRFNPTITTVGKNSSEWEIQNLKSSRNFIRKWGHFVRHDEWLHPIVPHKYNIVAIIQHATFNLLANLEPWFDRIQVDLPVNVVLDYINQEQDNTKFDLSERIDYLSSNLEESDIVCYIDGSRFTGDDFYNIQYLSDIITENRPDIGSAFQLGNMRLKVNKIKTYEHNLIVCKNEPIKL